MKFADTPRLVSAAALLAVLAALVENDAGKCSSSFVGQFFTREFRGSPESVDMAGLKSMLHTGLPYNANVFPNGDRAFADYDSVDCTRQRSMEVGCEAIVCYQCNSAFDPRCGDPFDPYSLGTVNCSFQPRLEHLSHLEPTLCRKISQKVYGKLRIVRGCGYITDERDNSMCMRRAGTHDVMLHYCACTGDLCNSTVEKMPSFGIICLISIVIPFLKM